MIINNRDSKELHEEMKSKLLKYSRGKLNNEQINKLTKFSLNSMNFLILPTSDKEIKQYAKDIINLIDFSKINFNEL